MTLKELIEGDKDAVVTLYGLRVDRLRPGLLNIMNADQSLTQAELDAFRVALKKAGYREEESWVATQGASWLGPGVFAGVSIRVAKA